MRYLKPLLLRIRKRLSPGEGSPAGQVDLDPTGAESTPFDRPPGGIPPWRRLTETEREIARMLAGGLTNTQIAREKHIAVDTVRTHVRNIKLKYGVRSREALCDRIRRDLDAW